MLREQGQWLYAQSTRDDDSVRHLASKSEAPKYVTLCYTNVSRTSTSLLAPRPYGEIRLVRDQQSVNTKLDLNSIYEDEQNAGRQ